MPVIPDGYKVERSLTGVGDWSEIATVAYPINAYADEGLDLGEEYFYRVRPFQGLLDGDYSNVASAVTEMPAMAAHFEAAASQSLANTTTSDFDMGGLDFTAAAWVYLDSVPAAQGGIITLWNTANSAQRPFAFYIINVAGTARPAFQVTAADADTRFAFWGSGLALGTWHLVIGGYDETNKRPWVNVNAGTAVNGSAWAKTPAAIGASTVPLRVGAFDNGGTPHQFLDGRVDSLGFWISAAGAGGMLSGAQQTALYNGGAGLNYGGLQVSEQVALISWWDLEEDTGETRLDAHGSTDLLVATTGPTRIDGLA